MSSRLNSSFSKSTNASSIRAIPSNLTSRSAPSIPPASQVYEPLVKAVLRHRLLYRLFPHTLLFSWALVVLWSDWQQGGLGYLGLRGLFLNPLMPTTFAFTIATWVVAIVPLVILRKSHITVHPATASSPSKTLCGAFSKANTRKALLTHLTSATCLAFLHILMAYTNEQPTYGDPHLRLFVKSKKHPYYINGRTLYLVTFQMFLAIASVLRDIMLDRFVVRWSDALTTDDRQSSSATRIAHALTAAFTVIVFPVFCTAVHTIVFGVLRAVALPILFKLPILSALFRPVAAHFLRGPWTLSLLVRHASVVRRAYYLGVTTLALWEFAEALFDAVVSEPVTVSHLTADPVIALVSGGSSSDMYTRHFAYAELRCLAMDNSPSASARRVALFADQKFNPNLWSSLARESLLLLGKDYQLLLRRGKPEAPAPSPAPAQEKAPLPIAPSTPLIRTGVLKASAPSPIRAAIDTFASDGVFSTAVASTSDNAQMPEVFRSVLASPEKTVHDAVATLTGQTGVNALVEKTRATWRGGVCGALVGVVPVAGVRAAERIWSWWTRDRVHKAVEMSLPNRQLDALIVEVLSHLTCASLVEDQYGVVQRDIPKIMEAMLSFLSAIEEHQVEINSLKVSPTKADGRPLSAKEEIEKERVALEVAKASALLGEIEDPLKEGVARIVRTFGDKLSAFKFPPRIASKLQGFVDYS